MSEITCSTCKYMHTCTVHMDVTMSLPNWIMTVDKKHNVDKIFEIISSVCPLKDNGPCRVCGEHKEDRHRMLCVSCDNKVANNNKKDK